MLSGEAGTSQMRLAAPSARKARVACGVLIAALACAVRVPEHPYELAPGSGEGHSGKRILLAPINALSPIPAELGPGAERVFAELRSQLASRRNSVQLLEGQRLQRAALATRGGESADALSVESAALLPSAVRDLLQPAGDRMPAELLLIPDVLIRSAALSGRMARWDGVRRLMPSPGTWTGNWTAASLRIRIFAPDGERVFEGLGGLELLFRANLSAARAEPLPELLANPRQLREGVAVALHPYFASEE